MSNLAVSTEIAMDDAMLPSDFASRQNIFLHVVDEEDLLFRTSLRLRYCLENHAVRFLKAHFMGKIFAVEVTGAQKVLADMAPMDRLIVAEANDAMVFPEPADKLDELVKTFGNIGMFGFVDAFMRHIEYLSKRLHVIGFGGPPQPEIAEDRFRNIAVPQGRAYCVGSRYRAVTGGRIEFHEYSANIKNEEFFAFLHEPVPAPLPPLER
ncbi:hypothetical protein LZK73_14845 [Neorhizobium galegae]|nr:hypothetical protein LZK73_14845 [Neorhizobium galegae]